MPANSEESYSRQGDPKLFVANSAISTAIKAKLAGDHLARFGGIQVDTDENGVVWLSGSAQTQQAIDSAVTLAQATADVRAVQSGIRIRTSD